MAKRKKNDIIQLDSDFSFEEAMQHLANVKASDVDEAMQNEEIDKPEDLPMEDEDCEPPHEC